MTRPATPRRTAAGLPASAKRRLARSEATTARTSFLTVPAAFGVRAAGFEAVGDVMGCVAYQTSVEYLGPCNVRSASTRPTVVYASSTGSVTSSFMRQLGAGYRTALDRLRSEAKALGADGVLGVRLEVQRHETLREFVAIGTAVRSTGRLHRGSVFTTDLPGEDVAKLLLAGWAPVELHVALQVGLRHIDQRTLYEATSLLGSRAAASANREVSGYTELRQQLTHRVGETLRAQVARSGAGGALLSSLTVDPWHRRCSSMGNSSDLVGLATAVGTSVVRFAVPSKREPAPLTIMPVGKGLR